MPKKIPAPNKDWLAGEYLLPPNGKGRTAPDIGQELGVSKRVVGIWVKELGLNTDSLFDRQSFRRTGVATWRKDGPDKVELASLYLMPPDGEGMALDVLASHYGVHRDTVSRWLTVYDLTQPFEERQAQRMAGEGNPAYVNGTAQGYHKNVLKRAGRPPERCEWCCATEDVQIHHKDHDRKNGDLDNLMWLCGSCNRLESHIWALQNKGLVKVIISDGKIEIKFLNK